MKKFFLLLPAAILFFASCATKSAYVLSGEWNVVNIEGEEITPSEETPFLGFNLNDNQIYGFTGCNRLNSTLNAKDFIKGKADFTKVATTRMMCQEDKYESKFLKALNQATNTEVNDDNILLKNKEGQVIITLKKRN